MELTKAETITVLRKRLGLKAREVAHTYNISESKISKLENGIIKDDELCDTIIENLQGELDAIAYGDGEPQY